MTSLLVSRGHSQLSSNVSSHSNRYGIEDSLFHINLCPEQKNNSCNFAYKVSTINYQYGKIYSFRFWNTSDSTVTFSIIDTLWLGIGKPEYQFADLTFDGYLDFRLAVGYDAKGRINFKTWTFNSVKMMYEYNKSFDDLPDEIILDPTDSTLTSQGYDFEACERVTWTSHYKVLNNELIEVKYTATTEKRKGKKIYITTEFNEYKNGQLQLVNKKSRVEDAGDFLKDENCDSK